MKFWRHLDSRNQESTTLAFVRISWFVVTLKYLIGGLTLGAIGIMPVIGTGEFGGAVTAILMVWLGREWTAKTQEGKA